MNVKLFWRRIISGLYYLDHDQRKQLATSCNTVTALVMVNYSIQGSGLPAVIMLLVSALLWIGSIIIVRKQDN